MQASDLANEIIQNLKGWNIHRDTQNETIFHIRVGGQLFSVQVWRNVWEDADKKRPKRCDAYSTTNQGICDEVLDDLGQCPYARNHVE
jgi:hypothetical protein